MTIHWLFSKDQTMKRGERDAKYLCIPVYTVFALSFTHLRCCLNCVDIFIVDKTILQGYVTGCLFAAVYV